MGEPLFCVDIFDTILTRLVGHPTSVFLLLGYRLKQLGLIFISAEEFAETRQRAENDARQLHIKGEVRFADIWKKAAEELRLTPQATQIASEQELILEEELIRPVPGAANRLADMRRVGKLAFLSNMYLPKSFITEQLQKHQLFVEGDALYISCDYDCSKSDGALFRLVLDKEGCKPENASHLGNDPISDVAGAQTAGIRATLYSDCELNRFERLLEEERTSTRGFSSLLAGTSRATRLEASDSDPRVQAIWEIAGGVAGPTLTAYLLWVFQRAKARGIERLYFVSRDGQVMLKLAEILAKRWGLAFELRYLYGSRRSWHLPSVTEIAAKELAWMTDGSHALTLESVLRRVNLEPFEIRESLAQAGFSPEQWHRNLQEEDRDRLARLFREPEVSSLIIGKAQECSGALLQYLQQEGLFDPVKSAIVDVGWTGRMLDSLAALLERVGGTCPVGFYFGLVGQGADGGAPKSPREGFYLDAYDGIQEPIELPARAVLLETFCAGDHGQVHSFSLSHGSAHAVLQHPVNKRVVDWGLPEFRRALTSYVENLPPFDLAGLDARSLALPVGRVLDEFWRHPSRSEAVIWGSFPYCDDQAESCWDQLARPFQIRDLFRFLHVVRGSSWRPYSVSWEAASLALTPQPLRSVLGAVNRIGSIYNWLRKSK